MQLQRMVIFLLASLFFLFTVQTVEASDYSGRQLFAVLEELARKGSFNIFADAPDVKIASFTASDAEDPALTLTRLAETHGLLALTMGDSMAIISRERYIEQQGLKITAVDFSRFPVSCTADKIRSILPKSVNCHVAHEAHSIFLSGFPDELAEAERLIDQLSLEQSQSRVYLQLAAADSETKSRFAFVCVNDMPASLFFQSATRPDALLATFTISLSGRDQARLVAAFASSADPSAVLNVNHDLDLQSKTAKESVVTLKNDIYNLSVRAEQLPAELIKVSMPSQEDDDDEIIIADDSDEEADVEDEENADAAPVVELNKATGEVLARIARQNGTNIVCGSEVAGTLSIFRFGEKPYFEEEFNLVARVKALKVRRIGNTWLVGAKNMRDAIDSNLYSVRRFNHSVAADRVADIKKMLSRLNLGDQVKVAHDTYSNTLITSGNSRVIDAIANYVRLADEQPDMVKLQINLNSGGIAFNEEIEVPAARQIRRNFTKADTRSGIAIIPGNPDVNGNISLKWLIQAAQSENQISISSHALLTTTPGAVLAEFDQPAATRLELTGAYTPRDRSADENWLSEGPVFDEPPEDTSEDPFVSQF